MRRDQVKAILKLGRFRFILAELLLYFVGALYAAFLGSPLQWDRLILGYLVLFLAHLSVSYSNDYFDRQSDLAGSPGPVSGGSGVLQEYPELAGWARGIALALIAGSLVLGLVFIALYDIDPWFFLFILAGNATGWFYSAPPLRLSGTWLGELATAVTMGILVPGMGYYVTRGSFDPAFLYLAVPFFLYGYFFIVSVEMPDLDSDRKSGKNTLVARKGIPCGQRVALLATVLASLFLVFTPLLGFFPRGLAVLGIFSIIPLGFAIREYLSPCTDAECITRWSARNIYTLVIFDLLANLYFLGIILYH